MAKKEYSNAFKERIVQQLLSPNPKTPSQIMKEENIPSSTLHAWIQNARKKGLLIPNHHTLSQEDKWRNEDKVRMLMETYAMNQEEIGLYCRKHGIYQSDLQRWQNLLEHAFEPTTSHPIHKEHQAQLQKLQKELRYKEKALAEAAALLVLQKKVQAIWGEHEDE